MIDDLLFHQHKRRTEHTILWDGGGGRVSLHPTLQELTLVSMENAKIQQSFQSATQNVTSLLKSNEIISGSNTSHDGNIARIKASLVRLQCSTIIYLFYSNHPSHRLNGSMFAERQFTWTSHLSGKKIQSLAGSPPSKACLGSRLNFSNSSRAIFPGLWLMPMSPSRRPEPPASPLPWGKKAEE